MESIPVVVRSGKVPRLRGLEEYISRYGPRTAVPASKRNVRDGDVRFVPLYLMWRINDYIR